MAEDFGYKWDSIPLDDLQGRWAVDTSTPPPPSGGARASLVELPGVQGGVVLPASDRLSPVSWGLVLNVTDAGGAGRLGLKVNYDSIMRYLLPPNGGVSWLEMSMGGYVKGTEAYVSEAVVSEEWDTGVWQLRVPVTLPRPVWKSQDVTFSKAGVLNETIVLHPFAGLSSRSVGGRIVVSGAFTRLRLKDKFSGSWLVYEGEVGANDRLTIELASLTAGLSKSGGVPVPVTGRLWTSADGFYLTSGPGGGVDAPVMEVEVTGRCGVFQVTAGLGIW